MTTCRQALFFSTHFAEPVASAASEKFDIIPAVRALSLANIEGLGSRGVWEFGPRLNVVYGVSGSGKTRVLEALKRQSDSVPTLPVPMPTDFSTMSFGHTVSSLCEILLNLQPQGSCLLMDDALHNLDDEHQRRLCSLLRKHDRQVIVTVKTHLIEKVRELSRELSARVFELELLNRGHL